MVLNWFNAFVFVCAHAYACVSHICIQGHMLASMFSHVIVYKAVHVNSTFPRWLLSKYACVYIHKHTLNACQYFIVYSKRWLQRSKLLVYSKRWLQRSYSLESHAVCQAFTPESHTVSLTSQFFSTLSSVLVFCLRCCLPTPSPLAGIGIYACIRIDDSFAKLFYCN